jgi:2-hydroxy-3-oxopropionate reductase
MTDQHPLRRITRVGFIGLGLMGKPMALNLIKKGFALTVHSRSRAPVDILVQHGATMATTPAGVASACDVIVTMVPDTPDVERVLAEADGVFEGLRPGSVVIDMSTIRPAAAQALSVAARDRGAWMLDAPVSGGEIGAIDGTLSIMVGGEAHVVEHVRPVLAAMGHPERITHVGPPGAGQVTKACNQVVLGATIAGVAEAFALARKNGVDPAGVRKALLGGFAQSRVLEVHGERMLKRNYVPGFRTELFVKDYRIVIDAMAQAGVAAPVTAVVQQLLNAAMSAGRAKDDYSSMATVTFEASGLGEPA